MVTKYGNMLSSYAELRCAAAPAQAKLKRASMVQTKKLADIWFNTDLNEVVYFV